MPNSLFEPWLMLKFLADFFGKSPSALPAHGQDPSALLEVVLSKKGMAKKNQGALEQAAPAVLANALSALSLQNQVTVLRRLTIKQSAIILTHLESALLPPLGQRLSHGFLQRVLATLEPDAAASIAHHLPKPLIEKALSRLRPGHRQAILQVMSHPLEHAGSLMNPNIVLIEEGYTVAKALKTARASMLLVDMKSFFYAFVVNETGRLTGLLPLWRMIVASPTGLVHEVMDKKVVAVQDSTDRESASRLALEHDLITLPVVDANYHPIGRITADDLMDVIHEENQEDMGRFSGTGVESVLGAPIWRSILSRLPWLLLAMSGEFLLSVVMETRQDLLFSLPMLAVFFPVMMAMGGNVGVQSASLVIRGLATGEVSTGRLMQRIFREQAISLGLGVVLAGTLFAGGWLLTQNIHLSGVLGAATLINIFLASTVGGGIPILFNALHRDPAMAAGPLLTTLNDMMGVGVYLLLAWLVLF